MNKCKKILAFLMALALLAAIPVTAVSAEVDASVIIAEEVLHSITVEETTGNGLAFLFTMNVNGATANGSHEFINTNATVTVDGATYQVVKMGAVLTNTEDRIAAINTLTLEDVDNHSTIDIPAKYLWDYSETTCSYTVRVINIPAQCKGYAIACRPYLVLKDTNGTEMAVYGNGDLSSFNKMHYYHNEEETPVLNADVADVDDKIAVTAAAAEYVAIAPTTYKEAFKVNLTLQNTSANAHASEGDWVEYTFYDADGVALGTEKVAVNALAAGESLSVEFYAPVATAAVEATATNLNYVPAIVLPAIGSDIDVAKKKNRIQVSAANAAFNENGTIAVSLTFKNKTNNWITEETDWVEYTCYDANGTVVKGATKIYIGCIDTKKNPVKIFSFDVPANTAEVKLTNSKIVYWTEWA